MIGLPYRLWFTFILIFLIFSLAIKVDANSNNIIDDNNQYFNSDERKAIESELEILPEFYKIIVLPSVTGTIEDTSTALFKHRQLSQDTILILVLTEDKKIFATTGEALEKKGLDEAFFKQEIENYFMPVINNESLSQAIIELAKGISMDVPNFIVKEKNMIRIPETPESAPKSDSEYDSWKNLKLLYWVGGLIIILMFWLLIKRKRFNIRK